MLCHHDLQLCYVNVHELWKRTYPRDGMAYGNLANGHWEVGLCDKAVDTAAESVRRWPRIIHGPMHF